VTENTPTDRPASEAGSVAPVPPLASAAPVAPAAAVAPAPQPFYAPQQPPKGLAVASMILGIGGLLLSIFGFGFLIVVAAVITGHLAMRRQPHARGYWITGLITGYLGVAFSLVYAAIWANYFYRLLT
jgi:hypothetical protein